MPGLVDENKATRVLIVDDDPGQRSLLHSFLRIQGFQTTPVESGEEALRLLKERPFDLMISDVRMPGISGLETMRRARAAHPALPILLVTAYADIREAVGAVKDGALNYLSKPIDLDELLSSVRHAVGLAREIPLKFEDKHLPSGIIASSPLVQTVFRDASLVAQSDSRILITGESGVGKQVLAQVIHQWSSRSHHPLVTANCASTPDTSLETELFGDEKAGPGRQGGFRDAGAGTLVLDQIAELPAPLQLKLLRVIETGSLPDESGADRPLAARLIVCTNSDLEEQVRSGRFREDLFYRLNVVELNVPPMRERKEDVIPLANQFLGELSGNRAKLSPAAAEILQGYTWPGNIRELRNAMERAALLSRGELILPEHLPARIRDTGQGFAETPDAKPLEEMEEQAIVAALRKHSFNRSDTARALGISRRGLIYKLQHLRERGYKVDPD